MIAVTRPPASTNRRGRRCKSSPAIRKTKLLRVRALPNYSAFEGRTVSSRAKRYRRRAFPPNIAA